MIKRITMLAAAAAAAIAFALPASAVELTTPRLTRYTVVPEGVTWISIAASPDGRAFQSVRASSEYAAMQLAKNECENKTARTCKTMTVPVHWDITAMQCYRGGYADVFLGGSQEGAATWIAQDKASRAGYGGCVTIAGY